MKSNKNIVSALLLSVCFLILGTACTKLDDRVYSEIVASKYEPTPLDGLAKIGSAYTPYKGLMVRMLLGMNWDNDQCFCPVKPWGWTYPYQLFNHNYNSTSPEVDGPWNSCYSGITACNRTISELQQDTETDNTDLIKELEALRSSYYYWLCDLYGNVAWSDTYYGDSTYLPKQIRRDSLAMKVEKGLLDAAPYLYTEVSKKTYGRFTKWADYALLAKLYLNWGVFVYGDGDKGRWQECLNYCDSIINSGNFGLTSTQKEIFSVKNDFSREAIFAVVFDEKMAKGLSLFETNMNGQHVDTYQKTGSGWANGGSIMVPQFIDTFDPDDSRLRSNHIYGPQYDHLGNLMKCGLGSIAGEDFVILNEVLSCEGSSGDNCTENMGYRLGKWEYEMGLDGSNMNNDVFPLRYADVLMMKAECLLRLNKADEAAEIVTSVRRRSFTSASEKATVTGAQLLEGSCYAYGVKECIPKRGKYPKDNDGNWIYTMSNPGDIDAGGEDIVFGRFLDELGWEFEQEAFHRRDDLIRFKTTQGEPVWTAKSWSSHKATHNMDKILYPIMMKELQANPNLKQNKGYE